MANLPYCRRPVGLLISQRGGDANVETLMAAPLIGPSRDQEARMPKGGVRLASPRRSVVDQFESYGVEGDEGGDG